MPVIDIVIPEEAGEVQECVVVTWLKREGDAVKAGEEMLILQAEKVSFEVPAPADGVIIAVLAQQGEVVERDQPLARLEVSEVAAAEAGPAPEAEPPAPAREVRASPAARRLARERGLDLAQVPGSGEDGRITEKDVLAWLKSPPAATSTAAEPLREVRATPIARRLAREHGLDLAQVPGSGEGGRITEKDIQTYLAAQPTPAKPAPEVQTIPMAGMRAAIAQRMQQSLQEMAQLTLHTGADVTALVALREQIKESQAVTYTDLIIKACALALREHPQINVRLEEKTIRLLPEINIGLAVALEQGLVVPVIEQADRLSLADLARTRTRLADRARAGQLTTEEMSGGTFTVTNLGMYDIDAFTPIINPPEAAILGVGRIVDKVVIYQGKIAQRAMMTLSLTVDHRLVDGAPAAAFLQTVKRLLETAEF